MLRPLFALSALALTAAPASASSYAARPAAPAPSDKIIVRDISWRCGPETCVGSTDKSRPLVLCQALAMKAGRLESFSVDGRAIPAADLDRCNASAKVAPERSLASQ